MIWRIAILTIALAVGAVGPSQAQRAEPAVCLLKGDFVSGLNRICVYDCAGSERHLTLDKAKLCKPRSPDREPEAARRGEVCRHTGERVSGRNRICIFSCPGGEAATTIAATLTCPHSLSR